MRAGWAPMLSFIARNGGVEVSGAWGCGGSIAASASQYIHHKGGESPALPPHPGVARTADPWALGAGGCCVCPLQRSPRGAHGQGPGRLLRECDVGSREASGPSIALKQNPHRTAGQLRGWGGRKSTAISFRPWGGSLPVSQLGKLRHRGEGSPLTCLRGHHRDAGAMWVGAG